MARDPPLLLRSAESDEHDRGKRVRDLAGKRGITGRRVCNTVFLDRCSGPEDLYPHSGKRPPPDGGCSLGDAFGTPYERDFRVVLFGEAHEELADLDTRPAPDPAPSAESFDYRDSRSVRKGEVGGHQDVEGGGVIDAQARGSLGSV